MLKPAYDFIIRIFEYFCHFYNILNHEDFFVLRVKRILRPGENYYPPPGYGLPPGEKPIPGCCPPKKYFALVLHPAKLTRHYLTAAIITFFVPVIFWATGEFYRTDKLVLLIIFSVACGLTIIATVVFIMINHLWMRPVLDEVVWMWPKSRYELFLSVPVIVPGNLIKTTESRNSEKFSWYWQPDRHTPLRYQPISYAKGRGSVQETVYHLALFDFLFDRKTGRINTFQWAISVGSPVVVIFCILTSYLFIFQFVRNFIIAKPELNVYADFKPLLDGYPEPFLWMAVFWGIYSFIYISIWIKYLNKLLINLQAGNFESFLDGIPRQITQQATLLPNPDQLITAIKQARFFIQTAIGIVLVNFLVALEVFSNMLPS